MVGGRALAARDEDARTRRFPLSREANGGKAVSIGESVGRLPLNKIIIRQVAEKSGGGGRDEPVHSARRELKDDRVAPI